MSGSLWSIVSSVLILTPRHWRNQSFRLVSSSWESFAWLDVLGVVISINRHVCMCLLCEGVVMLCLYCVCVCKCVCDVRPRLRQELHGFTYLIEVLDLTLRCAEEAQRQLNDQEVDLCCEVLKILFNVTVGMEATPLDEVTCEAILFDNCVRTVSRDVAVLGLTGKMEFLCKKW